MLIYTFDGSFGGLLCCVFKSFIDKEYPDDVRLSDNLQLSLTDKEVKVLTDDEQIKRITLACEKYLGNGGLHDLKYAFRSGKKDKYKTIFDYVKKAFEKRRDISGNFSDETVMKFYDLIKSVSDETHLLKGFIRFSQTQEGIYYAHVRPDADVVALLLPHFAERFKNMRFAIHDEARNVIALYNGFERKVVKLNGPITVNIGKNEEELQSLWREYYNSVNIKERENIRLMQHYMPKKYQTNLFEKSLRNRVVI